MVKVEEASFKAELKTTAPALLAVSPAMEAFPTPALRAAKPKQLVSGTVTAPMTGKIISIKVGKGEQVKAGQVLCILEAMKMENEITAPVAGMVREVLVSEGASVSEGDPLFVIG
ncbi:biotin/lipoyl-binding protein [Candidatus Bathyarchaeota archaeon]|nr:biotin/lipoyl-binding protein [Candidatus Bathyarchaeota archaeon]